MGRGHGGTGTSTWRANAPRFTLVKGTPSYKDAQTLANILVGNASGIGKGYNSPMGKVFAEEAWDESKDRIEKVLAVVKTKGNSFEKSVAESISKTIRPFGKGSNVAYISSKQSWVISKSVIENNSKLEDFGIFM